MRGITAVAVESDSFTHLLPWGVGQLPRRLAVHLLPAAWWLVADIQALGRLVEESVSSQVEPDQSLLVMRH